MSADDDDPIDRIPDVRDGLTRAERIILVELEILERERDGANVPLPLLYGRVVGKLDLSIDELQRIVARLAGRGVPGR
jgi:hypothetical protein